MSNGLSPELFTKTYELLLRFSEFDSLGSLKTLFTDARISPWGNELSDGENKSDRVKKAIAFLYTVSSSSEKENGLLLFLQVLHDFTDAGDKRHPDLANLINQLSPKSQDDVTCPYRGLEVFQSEHADIFFGRKTFTKQLVQAVQSRALTIVIGASGSGKSSVVMAGLIPALKKTEEQWFIFSFRPDKDPFMALARVLVPLYELNPSLTDQAENCRKLATKLKNEDILLGDIFQMIKEKQSSHHLLLIIDQFEELFTQTPSSDRQKFLDLLATHLHGPYPKLVLTLRADFYEQAIDHPDFAKVLKKCHEPLSPMTIEELTQAIKEPAERRGIMFEDFLIEQILDDMKLESEKKGKGIEANQPVEDNLKEINDTEKNESESEPQKASLPLLEFALKELWAKQNDGKLTHEAYRQIGQIKGALSKRATDIFSDLVKKDKNNESQIRHLFVKLVKVGKQGTQDTRQAIVYNSLIGVNQAIIDKLVKERLIVISQPDLSSNPKPPQIELVHEALIQYWELLRKWLDDDREFLIWREELRDDLKQWEDSKKDGDLLLRGAPLEIAKERLKERPKDLIAERDFIDASVNEKQRIEDMEHRRSQIMRVLTVLVAVVALLMIGFWYQSDENKKSADHNAATAEAASTSASKNAEIAQENRDAALRAVIENLITSDPTVALLLSKQLNELPNENLETALNNKNIFLKTLLSTNVQITATTPISPRAGIDLFAFSGDGQVVALGNQSGSITVKQKSLIGSSWDSIGEIKLGNINKVNHWTAIAVSRDGSWLALGTYNGELYLGKTGPNLKLQQVNIPKFRITSLAINSNNLLAIGTSTGAVFLLDVDKINEQSEKLPPPATPLAEAMSFAFNPTNELLAIGDKEGRLALYNMEDKNYMANIESFKEKVNSLAFNPKGNSLAIGGINSEIYLWAMQDNRLDSNFSNKLQVPDSRFSLIKALYFLPPDGQILVTTANNRLILWNINTKQVFGLPVTYSLPDIGNNLHFDTAGQKLLVGDSTGRIISWDMNINTWIQLACQQAGRNLEWEEWIKYFPKTPYKEICPGYDVPKSVIRGLLQSGNEARYEEVIEWTKKYHFTIKFSGEVCRLGGAKGFYEAPAYCADIVDDFPKTEDEAFLIGNRGLVKALVNGQIDEGIINDIELGAKWYKKEDKQEDGEAQYQECGDNRQELADRLRNSVGKPLPQEEKPEIIGMLETQTCEFYREN